MAVARVPLGAAPLLSFLSPFSIVAVLLDRLLRGDMNVLGKRVLRTSPLCSFWLIRFAWMIGLVLISTEHEGNRDNLCFAKLK